jgi:NAD(P)-dependent dehydrogenase (short-subunit alcohol dehydrogenase family)
MPIPMTRFLITGASSGIGRAVAKKLASRGATLLLNSRSAESLAPVAGECIAAGGVGVVHAADLTAPGVAETLFKAANDQLGGLDAVIHCAGIGLIKPALETTDEEFSRLMNVNARGTFLVAREACRMFSAQNRGLFITLPGIAGRAGMRNAAAYAASKFAVTGMLKCMAQEFQRQGVRICLLHFGGVDTPFWDNIQTNVQRDRMIPVDVAADAILSAIDLPSHLVLNEIVLQPEAHQL